tara:strand:+ start:1160 stop:4234 length:3075 start_codon:yes stop_codon:yes gene_type:complete
MTDQVNLGLVWASGGGTENPGDTKFTDGWISEIPTFQEFNFMLNALDSNTLHFAENAMFDWQADINYEPGARIYDATTAKIYTCRAAHINQAPTGDVSFSFWVEGWLVGSDFASLVQSDGFKIELTARTGTTYDGQDVTLVNNIPMLKLSTTDTSINWAIANVAGEICVVDLGNSGSPDGRNLSKGAGNSHRVFHEGHFPDVSEVVDAVEEAPNDGGLYARINEGWTVVTSTIVSTAPPPAVVGAGQGWYNVDDGQFYLDINDGDSSQWVNANPPVIPQLAESIRSVMGSASRNSVMTPKPLNGLTAATAGMESLLGTAVSGIYLGDINGFLKVTKDRNNATSWVWSDSIRGDNYLRSDSAGTEVSGIPTVNSDDITFTWQTTKRVSGLTNRGKTYDAHYNPGLGYSAVGFEGDGVEGHEISHYLGKEPELVMWKNRDITSDWYVQSPLFAEESFLELNSTDNLSSGSSTRVLFSEATISVGTSANVNGSTQNIIQYAFTSIPGVSKIGTYNGTSSAGNYIDCGFKVAWLLVKNLSAAGNWVIYDGSRSDSVYIAANLSNPLTAWGTSSIEFVDDGFVVTGTANSTNSLNDQYIFLAYAEGTTFDGTKTITNYDRPTNGNEVTVVGGTVLSYADGFDQDGELNFNEDVVGDTVVTLPANSESKKLWLYKDQGAGYGFTEFRPLEVQDYFGLQSTLSFDDVNVRTTDKHFGYGSATGVALASSEDASNPVWHLFNKDSNDIANTNASFWDTSTTTVAKVQYKYSEPRVLKSWRIRELDAATRSPRRFPVEGSNDGLVWTVVDSTYAASDYVGNGALLWGDIQDTSANTAAYLYYRLDITANNGHASVLGFAELEFNTASPSDRYDVAQGIMYNPAGSAILRTYIGSVLTDTDGDVVEVNDESVAKFKAIDGEFHGDVTVHGKINSRNALTAWAIVDLTTSPHTLLDGENVYSVTDRALGKSRITWDIPMDYDIYSVVATGNNLDAMVEWENRTKESVDISSYRDEADSFLDTIVCVQVTGGKKIL